jgi:hypothetical protein
VRAFFSDELNVRLALRSLEAWSALAAGRAERRERNVI